MRDVDITSKDVARLGDVRKLMDVEWAPCREACPVHADVRQYLEHIARAEWREAIDVIRENLPFAAACGRVCHHPCEANCRRTEVDKPVAIKEVKRFVAETQGAAGSTVYKAEKQDKARVAIVGGGPAGMSAALILAMKGYRPTVFEKFPAAGGIPGTAVPEYRLPRQALQMDIDWICAHGVDLITGVEIGRDKTISDLLGEGYEAVLIATGLAKSRRLPLPGADHEKVFEVLDFLVRLKFGPRPEIGDDVLVIGGGNVAMDAARSALRLGPSRVRAICLEDEIEIPAWEWELREAKEEGVEIIHRRGPVEIKVENGKIIGMKARKVIRVFDEEKRFNPQYDDSDVIDIECDTVIFAIGQAPDHGYAEGSGLQIDERGRLVCDPATHTTSLDKVFACGEIITPPGSIVESCQNGKRAAAAIDMYLSGKPIEIDDSLAPKIEKIPEVTAEKIIKRERAPIPTEPPESRRRVFTEFEHTYDSLTAACEARRCMGCGGGAEVLADKCSLCLTCVRVCPFDIPKVTDIARIDSTMCQACGICIAECPANAIVARSYAPDDLVTRTVAALDKLNGAKSKIVAYIGGFQATPEEWRGEAGDAVPGVAEIYLQSTSRISVPEILHAFERGADAVAVVCCADGSDRYPQVYGRTKRRVEQARDMLKEVGIAPARIKLFAVADKGREAVREKLAGMAEKINQD